MPHWVINLIVLWVSQFCASVGFALAMPFAPYYIQELGITDPAQVKFWTTVITAGTPLSMALVSPLWGILADRHGRKPMVLRATMGAGIILFSAAYAWNVYVFVFLRLMQGIFSGVASAVITLVASNTPTKRQGFALGSLGSAQFSGNMSGLFFGGFLSSKFGYSNTFIISGIILFLSSFLVLAFVKENFSLKKAKKQSKKLTLMERFASLGTARFLLVLVLWMSISRRMDGGLLAIYIQELFGSLDGVAMWSGMINAAGSLGALFAGLAGSLLIDHFHPRKLLVFNSIGAAIMMLLFSTAISYKMLIPLRFFLMLFLSAFDPILNTWISKITATEKKGLMFGLAQSTKSCGMTIGPCLGGLIAWQFNTRMIYIAGTIMFLILIPLTNKMTKKVKFRD